MHKMVQRKFKHRKFTCWMNIVQCWIILHFGFFGITSAIQWLSLGKIMSVGPETRSMLFCDRSYYLTPRQRKFCRQYSGTMASVAQAASLAMKECRRQFVNEPWNCSTPYRRHWNHMRGSTAPAGIPAGSRESAYVHALSSAAVAFSVAKDCKNGRINRCGCDGTWDKYAPTTGGFSWGGCSANIDWGKHMSRMFTDVPRKRRMRRNTRKSRKRRRNENHVNFYNNNFGRKKLMERMGRKCKCHGPTGSCQQQTCWRSLPNFEEIGATLKRNYAEAQQVHVVRTRDGRTLVRPKQLSHRWKETLAYLRKSPAFCRTAGRKCSLGANGPAGCKTMCCGRGYTNRTVVERNSCQCSFQWCCSVSCKDVCVKEHVEQYCL